MGSSFSFKKALTDEYNRAQNELNAKISNLKNQNERERKQLKDQQAALQRNFDSISNQNVRLHRI